MKQQLTILSHYKTYETYQHLHLVEVLGLATAVLDLLAEDEVELEEEHPPFARLPDQLLGVPHVEGVLQIYL